MLASDSPHSELFRTISVQIQDFQTEARVLSQHTGAKSKVKEDMK